MKKKLHLFFDLDESLVAFRESDKSDALRAFFLEKGIILNISTLTYYVFPGVRELMRWLLIDLKDVVEVAFFSAGDKRRNELLVPLLLAEILTAEEYTALPSKPCIFSNTDMIHVTQEEISQQQAMYQLPRSWGDKKSLQQVEVHLVTSSTHRILIDDGAWNVAPGEEGSFLCTPRATLDAYAALAKEEFEADFTQNATYRAANSIYYMTGVLSECINRYQTGCLDNYLFELEFEVSRYRYGLFGCCYSDKFTPCFEATQKTASIYHAGLQNLHKINPDLTFNDAESYAPFVASAIPSALEIDTSSSKVYAPL
ncbi:MAG: hypothetical protein P1U32_05940 [Legionellaceae bacterium]|nr:hypothetical protein [Legionellaceae bacterium]